MIDLLKAQIQSAKLISQRAIKAVQDSLNEYIKSNDSRVNALEAYRHAQESANTAGSKTIYKGSVEINENLNVKGLLTAKGEEIATKNFVLANSSGGANGTVEMTKTYNYVADGSTDTFNASFIGTSVAVFRNGFKLSSSTDEDYTLNYDANDANKGVSVTLKVKPDNGDIIDIVAYGGADVYSRTQVDAKFIDRDTIINTYATKESVASSSGDTGWIDLKPYLVNDWVEYSDTEPIRIRKIGKMVYIEGLVKDGSSDVCIEGIPEEYRPSKYLYLSQPSRHDNNVNSDNSWTGLEINPNGRLRFGEYSTTWTSLCCSYLVD